MKFTAALLIAGVSAANKTNNTTKKATPVACAITKVEMFTDDKCSANKKVTGGGLTAGTSVFKALAKSANKCTQAKTMFVCNSNGISGAAFSDAKCTKPVALTDTQKAAMKASTVPFGKCHKTGAATSIKLTGTGPKPAAAAALAAVATTAAALAASMF